jgi:hypothetical protein
MNLLTEATYVMVIINGTSGTDSFDNDYALVWISNLCNNMPRRSNPSLDRSARRHGSYGFVKFVVPRVNSAVRRSDESAKGGLL